MQRFANRQGRSLAFRDEGEGPAVVFLHGVGSRLDAWDGVLERLPRGRRHICADLRGHGASDRIPGPYTLAEMAGDVTDLADHLGLARFALVGFSLGGLVAQRIAIDRPERLRALVLISTVAGRTEQEKARVRARRDTLRRDGPLEHLANSVERWFTDAFIAANPEALARRRAMALENDPDCYMAAYEVLTESDLADEAHRIAAPTLVMTGEHDIGSTPRMARLLHGRIPGAEIAILDGLKHSVLLEAPDLVAGRIGDFLARRLGPSSAGEGS